MAIKAGRTVVIWRVDVIFLRKRDWKYEGSEAGAGGCGQTHTFGLHCPADKLRGAAAFAFPNVILRGGKTVLAEIPDKI